MSANVVALAVLFPNKDGDPEGLALNSPVEFDELNILGVGVPPNILEVVGTLPPKILVLLPPNIDADPPKILWEDEFSFPKIEPEVLLVLPNSDNDGLAETVLVAGVVLVARVVLVAGVVLTAVILTAEVASFVSCKESSAFSSQPLQPGQGVASSYK